ncbi:uncharacterized protein LMH87_007873 [Akanthomyces muscarius]|uniref:Prolyl 4-hydroxylase alpha subunit Fe(2+) 2OG dioxygenase domain-containing protein n=1 Tax=Akanthomyces muscarius TaxID=2231603 RepID=A0A9W8QJ32_AKAMU|nr:uncharacterized protein LMH87_007873 [Akanthomyces muscarius]KAJ4159938.1 hypothetical protein LMH87_007873 [Akanthomyces muscarius]
MSSPEPEPQAIPALDELKKILAEEKHLYACGGRIPIATPTVESEGEASPSTSFSTRPRQSAPVTIRWDMSGLSHADDSPCRRKVTLPATQKADRDALSGLIKDCQPATFGLKGQDVYDETYRKALKMNPDAFCSTFDPYSTGIIDIVAQMLLPSFGHSTTRRAVDAKLYKLNIYSGPSGMFKAHVDTPRSPTQFGSLVVCLPVEHRGGQLKVRHQGEETTFDWSMLADRDETMHIEWAAFYSDCEHEVMHVSSGNRLTLTYNLFAVHGAGRLTGNSLTLDPTRLPLYHAIERMVNQDPFSGNGGTLGFWCSHAYAYNDSQEAPLPATLKGADAAIWEILKALGIHVTVSPILKMDDDIRPYLKERVEDNKYNEKWVPAQMPSQWIIGKKFGIMADRGGSVEETRDHYKMYKRWGSYSDGPIYWLTTPTHAQLQLIYVAYGNEARAKALYSHCAILATLPPKDSASTG